MADVGDGPFSANLLAIISISYARFSVNAFLRYVHHFSLKKMTEQK